MRRQCEREPLVRARRSVLPESINYNLLSECNMKCRFCFSSFSDLEDARTVRYGLSASKAVRLVEQLARHTKKITFVGGEPTLFGHLLPVLRRTKELGVVTMLVTNGSTLACSSDQLIKLAPHLDWVGLSIDSTSQATNRALGRSVSGRVLSADDYLRLARRLAHYGIRLKLNTVVTALNVDEDMSTFVGALRPKRWKLLQVLPVRGQNTGGVDSLVIETGRFEAFAIRHERVSRIGVQVVAERNKDMTGSYAMVSPDGRFFDNTCGRHTYSDPILDVGFSPAWAQVRFDRRRFERRGALYDWDDMPSRDTGS